MASEQSKTHTILGRIASGEILISDGATGTYLQQHGLEAGGCPEEFNASHPYVVQGMAGAYFGAGSDMVLTNSFGGSRFMQKKYGYEGRGERVQPARRRARRQSEAVGRPLRGWVGRADGRDDGAAARRGQRVRHVRRSRRADDRARRGWSRRDPGRDTDGSGGSDHWRPRCEGEHGPAGLCHHGFRPRSTRFLHDDGRDA